MSALPPEIISSILSFLPVKSLLRFRPTSKHFCSTIDGPDFSKLHLRSSAQTRSHRSIILNTPSLRSVELHSLHRSVEIDHPLKTVRCRTAVVGSCNGLLCLVKSESEIVIWNKAIGKHHRVPYAPIDFATDLAASLRHQVAYGFGYDSVHDDYKIVRIVRFRYTSDSEFMIYSLKSNSWRKILDRFEFDFNNTRPSCVFADGALHWLVSDLARERSSNVTQRRGLIYGFDLAAEKSMDVPLPPVFMDLLVGPVQMRIGTWEGRLCVVSHLQGKLTHAYVHNGSWADLLSITLPRVTGSPSCVMPIARSSNGDEVLLLKNNKKFIWYDLKTKQGRNVRGLGLEDMFEAVVYVESLVSPLPPVDGVGEAVSAGKGKSGPSGGGKTKRYIGRKPKTKVKKYCCWDSDFDPKVRPWERERVIEARKKAMVSCPRVSSWFYEQSWERKKS